MQIGRLDGAAPATSATRSRATSSSCRAAPASDRLSLRDGRATRGRMRRRARQRRRRPARRARHRLRERDASRPQPGGARLTVATLPFPFPGVNDVGRSTIAVEPLLPLHGDAILLRVSCPAGLGLLELVRALPCTGRVRFARSDGFAMGMQRVRVPRGGTITLRLPLHQLTRARAPLRRPVGHRDRAARPRARHAGAEVPRARLKPPASALLSGAIVSPESDSCSQYSSAGLLLTGPDDRLAAGVDLVGEA